MHNIYLALYKGTAKRAAHRLADSLIRLTTGGQYSHCEIAVERLTFASGERYPDIFYDCYSASLRDGGVRCKRIDVSDVNKWDLIPLDISEEQVLRYFEQTKSASYDLVGAIGVALGIKHSKRRYFCSEWCYNAIFGGNEGHKFSPNELAKLLWSK